MNEREMLEFQKIIEKICYTAKSAVPSIQSTFQSARNAVQDIYNNFITSGGFGPLSQLCFW